MKQKKIDSCIAACSACVIACLQCLNNCLSEGDLKKMARCLKLNQDCANVSLLTMQALAGDSEFAKEICKLCEDICNACAEECEKHSHTDHCKKCAEACRQCAEECRKMNKVDKGNL